MLHAVMDKVSQAFKLLLLFTVILGLGYPLLVTGVGQLIFPWEANGSLIANQERVLGSALIGQYFSDPKYFWGRLSATATYPYNAQNSMASNLAASNPILITTAKKQIQKIQVFEAKPLTDIPIDLVTASASGLDPDISPLAAYYQVSRIAKARDISEESLRALIKNQVKGRFLGVLGESRLNVLELNLILDNLIVSKVKK